METRYTVRPSVFNTGKFIVYDNEKKITVLMGLDQETAEHRASVMNDRNHAELAEKYARFRD